MRKLKEENYYTGVYYVKAKARIFPYNAEVSKQSGPYSWRSKIKCNII